MTTYIYLEMNAIKMKASLRFLAFHFLIQEENVIRKRGEKIKLDQD